MQMLTGGVLPGSQIHNDSLLLLGSYVIINYFMALIYLQ